MNIPGDPLNSNAVRNLHCHRESEFLSVLPERADAALRRYGTGAAEVDAALLSRSLDGLLDSLVPTCFQPS